MSASQAQVRARATEDRLPLVASDQNPAAVGGQAEIRLAWWRRLCPSSFALAGITVLVVWSAVGGLLSQGRLDTVTVNQLQQPHVQQLTKPYLLSGPVAPKPMRVALAGALAGIMLAAIVVAFLFRRLLKRLPLDQHD